MNDLISRQDAIDAIYEHEFSNWCDKDEVSDILNNLPSANQWIPCSDGLPYAEYGESDSVLCYTESGLQKILYFNGGCWCHPTGEVYEWNFPNGHTNRVVTWMPLPEPWKGEKNEN